MAIVCCVSTSTKLESVSAQNVDYDYEITSYDININVNENNVYNIIETLNINYRLDRHGIERKIPVYYILRRADGTKARCKARISNIHVTMDSSHVKASYSPYDDEYTIRIGDPDNTIIGSHVYTISYDYNFGKDNLKGNDEFYFNLIGTQWNTSIDNLTFSITMPKDFTYTEETLGFTWGELGKRYTNHIIYDVVDKTISGLFDQKL